MTDTAPQARDEAFISKLHRSMWLPTRDFLFRARSEDIPVGITQGFRSFSDQAAVWARGRELRNGIWVVVGTTYTDAPPGSSWHEYGLAFDVAIDRDPGPKFLARWPNDVALWRRIGELGKTVGFEWGGDWKPKPDLPHFQWLGALPGQPGRLTLADARAGKRPAKGPYE